MEYRKFYLPAKGNVRLLAVAEKGIGQEVIEYGLTQAECHIHLNALAMRQNIHWRTTGIRSCGNEI